MLKSAEKLCGVKRLTEKETRRGSEWCKGGVERVITKKREGFTAVTEYQRWLDSQ